ncbi:DUF2442 domain-containing protein [uncultured Thiodictyon sp.]|uniref:DUF2442 domain-containing protein n=1 Tax=uncultured Thiodictyon sp. TaxID=1846217 RepID=UPI0025DFEF99|nr:DUF2442 domain-containing protein [uncultured Thiodictyon sp.]
MALMKRPRLSGAEALTGHRLRLTFVDGRTYTLDFTPLLDASPGLAPLREASAFAGARVIPGEGWAVTWPALDIQIGADTLWLDVQAQQAPDENTRTFVQWRARHGLSLAQAAAALGLTPRTVSAYGTGARPVPRYIALACKGWEADRGPR